MGAWRVVVLTNKMIYEVLGTVPGITQVPPHMLWRFGPKGPEPGSMSPLAAEAGELGLVVVAMVWGWVRCFKAGLERAWYAARA